jgi:hypothetical protein
VTSPSRALPPLAHESDSRSWATGCNESIDYPLECTHNREPSEKALVGVDVRQRLRESEATRNPQKPLRLPYRIEASLGRGTDGRQALVHEANDGRTLAYCGRAALGRPRTDIAGGVNAGHAGLEQTVRASFGPGQEEPI